MAMINRIICRFFTLFLSIGLGASLAAHDIARMPHCKTNRDCKGPDRVGSKICDLLPHKNYTFGVCVEWQDAYHRNMSHSCTNDDACPSGLICQKPAGSSEGLCQLPTECESDADCSPGYGCNKEHKYCSLLTARENAARKALSASITEKNVSLAQAAATKAQASLAQAEQAVVKPFGFGD